MTPLRSLASARRRSTAGRRMRHDGRLVELLARKLVLRPAGNPGRPDTGATGRAEVVVFAAAPVERAARAEELLAAFAPVIPGGMTCPFAMPRR